MSNAILLVNCFNKVGNVQEKLTEISDVKEVKPVIGAYDYVVKIEDISKKELQKLIRKEIRSIENVRSTLILHTTQHD